MASTTFLKLKLDTAAPAPETITYNDLPIVVKQYLPIEKKIELIANVIAMSATNGKYLNPMLQQVFFDLEVIYAYTDIVFTDKQKENPLKLYDTLEQNGIFNLIIEKIPSKEYLMLRDWLEETTESYYNYKASIVGVVDSVIEEFKDLDLEASDIQEKLSDEKNLTFLKDVVTKLG